MSEAQGRELRQRHHRPNSGSVLTSGARGRIGVVAFLAVGSVYPATAQTGREAVAVFDIQPQDVPEATPARMAKLTGYLESVVAASGFRTVPRSEIQARIAEQQKESYKNCYDEACQIDLGKAVAAEKAVSSTWTLLGDACVLSVKLYDLKTGLAEFSTKADAACTEKGLRAAIDEISQALKVRITGIVITQIASS